MPDDLSGLEEEFMQELCAQRHDDACACAKGIEPLCECGHAKYKHWTYYGGLSGCGHGKTTCDCEFYTAAKPVLPLPAPDPTPFPLPVARAVRVSWWTRFLRWLGLS